MKSCLNAMQHCACYICLIFVLRSVVICWYCCFVFVVVVVFAVVLGCLGEFCLRFLFHSTDIHIPLMLSNTTNAPSVTLSAAVTSEEKSTWPGQSIRLTRYSRVSSPSWWACALGSMLVSTSYNNEMALKRKTGTLNAANLISNLLIQKITKLFF